MTVHEHRLGAMVRDGRPDPVALVASRPVVGDRPIEELDEAVRNLPALVPALIDDQSLLELLALELAHE